jgi:hypothetical protein
LRGTSFADSISVKDVPRSLGRQKIRWTPSTERIELRELATRPKAHRRGESIMPAPYRFIDVAQRDGRFYVQLRQRQLAEQQIHDLFAEMNGLVKNEGCRSFVLSLYNDPECLYSVFLAKLITLQRLLTERGGELRLSEVSPQVRAIFEACKLDRHFTFE